MEHPYQTVKKLGKKSWKYILKKKGTRRQDYKLSTFFENGAIYIFSKKLLIKNQIKSNKNNIMYVMPKIRSFDINDSIDLKICEKFI